jgi:hypothetical protein
LVEQRTENPRVGGSIPPLATNFLIATLLNASTRNRHCDGKIGHPEAVIAAGAN